MLHYVADKTLQLVWHLHKIKLQVVLIIMFFLIVRINVYNLLLGFNNFCHFINGYFLCLRFFVSKRHTELYIGLCRRCLTILVTDTCLTQISLLAGIMKYQASVAMLVFFFL